MLFSATSHPTMKATVAFEPTRWWEIYLLRSWSALLLSPAIAMINMSLAYNMVGPACEPQEQGMLLELISLGSVALSLFLSRLALAESRELDIAPYDDLLLKQFFATFSYYVALLFSLDTFAQALAILLMSPC